MQFNNRKMKILTLFVLSIITLAAGCGTVAKKHAIASEATPLNVSAIIGEEKFADVGDALFVKGTASKQKILLLKNDISSTMPGSCGFPFDFSVKKGVLSPLYQTANHIHYAASWEKSNASHSMLGVVISPGDSVGIRINKKNGSKEWYVDNSVHNRMNTVWSRKVRADDNVEFEWSEKIAYDDDSEYVEVVFDGFFNNLFHFTLTEVRIDSKSQREFRFNPDEGITRVSFKGMILDILKADNLGITYKWVKLP